MLQIKPRFIHFALAAFALLATAGPALAQETAEGGGDGGGTKINFAQMFLWSPDSPFGTAMIWLLLAMSVATIALLIHFVLQNRRESIVPPEAVGEIEALLGERKFRDAIEVTETDESVFGEIMHAALSEASNGYGAMERAVEETGDLAGGRRLRSIEVLNVLGAVGPMVGLFGTVYGMIRAFYTIVEKGGQPNPEDLAAGISTALVTTFWGLIVGIPAVAAAALIRNKIDALVTEAMIEADALIGRFRPGGGGGRKASPAGDKAAPATPKPKAE